MISISTHLFIHNIGIYPMFGDTPPTQLTLQKIGVPVAFKAKELVLSFKPIIHLHIRLLTANIRR